MQRDNLKDQYNEEIFQFHDCNAKHFTCKYQDVLINFDGQQKRTISVYLEDTPGLWDHCINGARYGR